MRAQHVGLITRQTEGGSASAAPTPSASASAPGKPTLCLNGRTPKEMLLSFYQTHNPAKLHDSSIDRVLLKYAGNEEQLFRNLAMKYNLDPNIFFVSSSGAGNGNGNGDSCTAPSKPTTTKSSSSTTTPPAPSKAKKSATVTDTSSTPTFTPGGSGQLHDPVQEEVQERAVAGWYAETRDALVAKALGGKALGVKGAKEAKQRSKLLATSADNDGVKFTGASFHAEYLQTKFERRGELMYRVLREIGASFGSGSVSVASFGSGPGCDGAGVVRWAAGMGNQSLQGLHLTLFDYETSWKRYMTVLEHKFQALLATQHGMPCEFALRFFPCDVRKPILSSPAECTPFSFAQPNLNLLNSAGLYDWDHGKPVELTREAAGEEGTHLLEYDFLLFSYVINETHNRNEHQFYRDLGRLVKPGAIFIFTDVTSVSSDGALSLAIEAIASGARLRNLELATLFAPAYPFEKSRVKVLQLQEKQEEQQQQEKEQQEEELEQQQ